MRLRFIRENMTRDKVKVRELHYSPTNTYLIEGEDGSILFDTGWAGTFTGFCAALGEIRASVADIRYILISHFHPDHMGISQKIADHGPRIIIMDVQKDHIHSADHYFEKEGRSGFKPITDEQVLMLPVSESRSFLKKTGFDGEILHTPGHSEDSISLWLDEGLLFVGDLNPLSELELHKGTEIGKSWEKLLALNPGRIYYGHAKTAIMEEPHTKSGSDENDLHDLVRMIMKLIDRGCRIDQICKKTGADRIFIEDVTRMYLTHQNVGVQGILDRIEIKNR